MQGIVLQEHRIQVEFVCPTFLVGNNELSILVHTNIDLFALVVVAKYSREPVAVVPYDHAHPNRGWQKPSTTGWLLVVVVWEELLNHHVLCHAVIGTSRQQEQEGEEQQQ